MRASTVVTVAAAALATAACQQGDRVSADTAQIERQLKAEETQWQKDYESRSVDALNSHYAEDGALASPGAALVSDAEGRKAALEPLAKDPNFKMEFASERVRVAESGDLAYTRGKFTMQSTDPASGQVRTDTGNYLTVWKKQPDGSWKAVEDFVTPGPPQQRGAADGTGAFSSNGEWAYPGWNWRVDLPSMARLLLP